MATGTRVPITIISGDTVELNFTVTNRDGTPKDLTGGNVAITWAMSASRGSAVLLTKTLGAGVTIPDPLAGSVKVTIDAGDTDAFAGDYFHELEVTDEALAVSTAAWGPCTILDDAP
jgi:hypothetical protein